MVLSGACLSRRRESVEENCSTYAFSDESGAVYRHDEKISFEKEVVSIFLILRISLVIRGDLEREGIEKQTG